MVVAARVVLGISVVMGALILQSCMVGGPVILEDEPRYMDGAVVQLRIQSRPRGTKIYLNGRFVGRTPLTIRRHIRESFVEVTALKNGFQKGIFYDEIDRGRGRGRGRGNRYVRTSVRKSRRNGRIHYRGRLYFRLPLLRGYRR